MKKTTIFTFKLAFISILLLITTCKDDIPKITKLVIGSESNVTDSTANIVATFIDISGNVTAFGFCWATSGKPGVSDLTKTNSGNAKKGDYNNSINGLNPNTKYYVRAYAMEGDKPIYSTNEISFTTLEAKYINVTAPVATDNWTKGSTQIISWTNNIDENVIIELYKGGTLLEDIIASTESDGSYNWTLSDGLILGTDYSVKISSVDDAGISSQSEAFEISEDLDPVVITQTATAITGNTATLNGTVNANGEEVTVSFEWGETTAYGNTVDAVPSIVTGTSVTAVSADISGLSNGATYHFRVLAENQDGTSYGNDISLTTHSLATVTTDAITEITSSSATSGGYVSSNGGSAVTDRGVCWSTSQNPTINDLFESKGSGVGTFTHELTGLSDNTDYYVRAYAINSVGTAYGNQQTFTTQAPFIAITSPVESSSWQVGTTHSIEWDDNISENVKIELFAGPTYLQDIASNTTNTGSYGWTIPILAHSDIYKIKISSVDDASIFDESEEFTIIAPSGSTGTVTDCDDNTYDAIKIGYQWWMAENLKVTHYDNAGTQGAAIPTVTDDNSSGSTDDEWAALLDNNTDKAYCYYNDNEEGEAETYGALYTWAAAMDGAAGTDANPSGIQGVCPAGWHLPSDDEWKELEMYLGMDQTRANSINWRGVNNEGGQLKEAGFLNWNEPNEGANNQSGFTALPGGFRPDDTGICVQLKTGGLWWTTTHYDGTTAWYRHLKNENQTVGRWRFEKSRGYSVRCVKD